MRAMVFNVYHVCLVLRVVGSRVGKAQRGASVEEQAWRSNHGQRGFFSSDRAAKMNRRDRAEQR